MACAPFCGGKVFCGGAAIAPANQAADDRRGPFVIPAKPSPLGGAALWRCFDEQGSHHFANLDRYDLGSTSQAC